MTRNKVSVVLAFAATVATLVVALGSVRAQQDFVDLSGIWWAGAPVPLLPGESPAAGMGMGMGGGGMGTNASTLALTEYGQSLMADFDPADDPAVSCVQAGLVRQIVSPYPIEVSHRDDAVVFRYEEWAVERLIHLVPEAPQDLTLSPMGYSVGYFEGSKLVVNSTGVTRGLARSGGFFWTSEEASVVEQYSLTERGQLFMEMELTDPVMLSEPWRTEKTWNPYDEELLDFDCILRERP